MPLLKERQTSVISKEKWRSLVGKLDVSMNPYESMNIFLWIWQLFYNVLEMCNSVEMCFFSDVGDLL